MSYSKEFIEFVVGQMSEAGTITYRLMFGAYSLYLDGKLFGIVGNDKVFIKQTKSGKAVIPEVESEPPYEGAKDYFLLEELDDRDLLGRFIRATVDELPERGKPNRNRSCKIIELDRLHTTELGTERIANNLGIEKASVVEWCRNQIKEGAKIEQRGKNFYVDIGNAIVTINAGSMTIITAHKK